MKPVFGTTTPNLRPEGVVTRKRTMEPGRSMFSMRYPSLMA
jgi:hypothetical protein